MKITLEIVRDLLRGTLGSDSFIASFIKRVEEDPNCATACITAEGDLRYNPEFVTNFIDTTEDLFCLIMHELMHPMFGHFVYGAGQLENMGADIVINASITQLFAQPSGDGCLFRKFYQPEGLQGLLRPGSRMQDSRYSRLYRAFYSQSRERGGQLSTGEVITSLKVLAPTEEMETITLLGDHEKRSGATGTKKMPTELLDKLAQDLKNAVQRHRTNSFGYNSALYDEFVDILRSHLSFKRAMLELFTTRQKVDRFRRFTHHQRISVSPVPLRPSKRDLVLIAAGMPPMHYHNRSQTVCVRHEGLAVYLDVSGSVNEHLPEIIGLLQSLGKEMLTMFLFSNAVVEVPFNTLMKGAVKTTYGTDFNCIAKSIIDRELDKAVIVTDGYATMTHELQTELKTRNVKVLTVLFGDKKECREFGALGDVVRLEDAVK